MTLLNAGYWQTTYWAEDYWNPRYWPKYGVVTVTPSRIPSRPRIRRKPLSRYALLLFRDYLELKVKQNA